MTSSKPRNHRPVWSSGPLQGLVVATVLLSTFLPIQHAGASEPYKWEPAYTLTDLDLIRDLEYNSAHDSMIVAVSFGLQEWGITNNTFFNSISTFGLELEDMEWNDRFQWMAWRSDHVDIDRPYVWRSEIVVFDAEGVPVTALEPQGELPAPENASVLIMRWCPGTPLLAVGFDDGSLYIYDVQAKAVQLVREGFESLFRDIAWNPDGTLLAVLAGVARPYELTLNLLDTSLNQTWKIPLLDYNYRDVQWYFDGSSVLLSGPSGDLDRVDIDTHECTEVCDWSFDAFAASPVGPTVLLLGGWRFWFIDLETGYEEVHGAPRPLTDRAGWTSDGSLAYMVDEDDIVRFWRRVPPPPPRVGFETPWEDAVVSSNVTITGWAESTSDRNESRWVRVKVGDRDWTLAGGFNPWNLTMDTTELPDGPVVVRAVAVDTRGESDVAVRRFIVDNTVENARPKLVITSPKDGESVHNIVDVKGTAEDDRGVVSVQFRIGEGVWKEATVDLPGPEVEWRVFVPIFYWSGNVTIQVRAFDGSDFSAAESVTVHKVDSEADEGMTVHVDYPGSGWTVEPTFTVSGHVEGRRPDRVLLLLEDDTVLLANGTSPWDVTVEHLREGNHVLRVRAERGDDYSPWFILQVEVSEGHATVDLPPTVEILRPANGTVLFESPVEVEGLCFDDTGVERVDVRVGDGEWKTAQGTSEWTYRIELDAEDVGYFDVEVRGFDGEQYSEVEGYRYYFSDEALLNSSQKDVVILVLVAALVVLILYIYVKRDRGRVED